MDNTTSPTFLEWLISETRIFLKDFAGTNKLLLEEEHKDGDIARALRRTISEFNKTAPPLSTVYSRLEDLPLSEETVIKMTVYKLLLSESLKRSRNDLTYSDGNLTINDDNKAQMYLQIANILKAEYLKEMKDVKLCLNVNAGMMGNNSVYENLYSSYLVGLNYNVEAF